MLLLCQKLDKNDQTVVAPVLQNNSYFCHPEDDKRRKFACEKILMAHDNHHSDRIRCFDKNSIKINFTSESYINMVDWEKVVFDSPPLLKGITSETIASNAQVILPHYPCHSQDVERNIKDVSAVCGTVNGHDSRHSVINQTKKPRLDLRTVETKADFLR